VNLYPEWNAENGRDPGGQWRHVQVPAENELNWSISLGGTQRDERVGKPA
jgi:hypothetical protein